MALSAPPRQSGGHEATVFRHWRRRGWHPSAEPEHVAEGTRLLSLTDYLPADAEAPVFVPLAKLPLVLTPAVNRREGPGSVGIPTSATQHETRGSGAVSAFTWLGS